MCGHRRDTLVVTYTGKVSLAPYGRDRAHQSRLGTNMMAETGPTAVIKIVQRQRKTANGIYKGRDRKTL
jgi:hypothetical protein